MKLRDVAFLGGALAGLSVGLLVYGAVHESKNLVLEEHTLKLPNWPDRLRGYRVAVLADLHLRGRPSVELAKRAVLMAIEQNPDMVVIAGDLVGYWQPECPEWLGEVLEPLLIMGGNAIAIPGNHDYEYGDPMLLGLVLDQLNIRLLRNESWLHDGIHWVGVDSAIVNKHRPKRAMEGVDGPAVCLWHEPDMVDELPAGCSLMIAGHSHGGQFTFPGGYTPMHTHLGRRYPRGFYPGASTPLYVSRGVGTTGPPSRLNCPPEVAILTLT